MSRLPALGAGVAGLLVAVLSAGSGAGRGVLSAALGVAVVVAFFGSGAWPLLLLGGTAGPGPGGAPRARAGAALLLLTYTLRLAAAFAVLLLAARSAAVDTAVLGRTVIAAALAWVAVQAARTLRGQRSGPVPATRPVPGRRPG